MMDTPMPVPKTSSSYINTGPIVVAAAPEWGRISDLPTLCHTTAAENPQEVVS